MGRKPSLGFPTQKEARAAIQAIVNQYGLEQEFFHPLIQRLFIEQPYWCNPPGPTFTKFKWRKHTLPNGATTERWFYCFDPKLNAWIPRSWNQAIIRKRRSAAARLREYARFHLTTPIVSEYRDAHPFCEHCKREGRTTMTAHVHHTTNFSLIVDEALMFLTAEDLAYIDEHPEFSEPALIELSEGGKSFVNHILQYHKQPGLLISLCIDHHYEVEGKTRRQKDTDI
jgi:hypothetical protein